MAKTSKRRIVFMGTPDFGAAILASLLGEESLEVAGVFTRPDRKSGRGMKIAAPPVKKVALDHGLSVWQPARLDDEACALLEELKPDLIVVASYGLILPEKVLSIAPCVNVHASLLPAWRGAAPIQRALEESWLPGAKTGVSIMKMEKGLDTGPVYCMAAVESAGRNVESLTAALAEAGAAALIAAIRNFEKLEPIPQEEAGITYAAKLAKKDGVIDWRMPAAAIEAKIRAMNPWPRIKLELLIDDAFVSAMILKADVVSRQEKPEPGKILLTSREFLIGCGENWLAPRILKPSGRKAMPVQDFINGYVAGRSIALAPEAEAK